jgi:hypothetical protein
MSKAFAWILFLSSVVAFGLQFRTQQIVSAADQSSAELGRPPHTQPDFWQTADASDPTSN